MSKDTLAGASSSMTNSRDAASGGDVNRMGWGWEGLGHARGGSKDIDGMGPQAKVRIGTFEKISAAISLQRHVRDKLLYRDKRLHRANLCARMMFERDLLVGSVRMLTQGLVFALILIGLTISNTKTIQKGILDSFESAFSLSDIESVDSVEAFVGDTLPRISRKAKDFFPLSSAVFDDGPYGHTMLLSDLTSFTAPVVTSPFVLVTEEFTVTAWVQTGANFLSGNLVKKRVPTTASADLTCWGLALHEVRGPMFVYGSHDFFPTKPQASPADPLPTKVVVNGGIGGRDKFPVGQMIMVSMVVTSSNVSFYFNDQIINTLPLTRAVTDCYNGEEGIVVGDASLQMGLVQIFPQALAQEKLLELYVGGRLLSDIATGSTADQAPEDRLANLGRQTQSILDGQQLTRDSLSKRSSLDHALALALTTAPAQTPPPDLALGRIHVNSTALVDVGGRQYVQLLKEMHRVPAVQTDDNWARYLANVPSFHGTGATLSYWYRHGTCVGPGVCGGYHFAWYEAANGGADWKGCFAFRINSDRPFAQDFSMGGLRHHGGAFPRGISPAHPSAWRHVAFQFNEVTDEVLFFLDGTLAVRDSWGSSIRSIDQCGMSPNSEKRVTIGYRLPGHNYGASKDIFDVRLYIHGSAGPLPSSHILSVAKNVPSPLFPSVCVAADDQYYRDSEWTDSFGHGCKWYFDQRLRSPTVCQFPKAMSECPISCQTRPVCWSEAANKPPNIHLLWDRIHKIEKKGGNNGAVCLPKGYKRETLLSECRKWAQSGREGVTQWNGVVSRGLTMTTLNITDCDVLMQTLDENCDFDGDAVKNFTAESKANGGDWTIAFWIRPTGLNSLHPPTPNMPDPFFAPRIDFLSSLTPPLIQLQTTTKSGQFMWMACSGCAPPNQPMCHTDPVFRHMSQDGWTFLAYSHKAENSSGNGLDRGNGGSGGPPSATGGEAVTNRYISFADLKVSEQKHSSGSGTFCPRDPESFLSAMVFHQEMLISPVMMVPSALNIMEVQQLYLERVNDMSLRNGPRAALQTNSSDRQIPIIKNDYGERSVLMASPIVFQTRHNPTSTCPTDFSTTFIKGQMDKARKQRCAAPFQCNNLNDVDIIGCQGEDVTDNVTLGLDLVTFQGQKGYADFLFSVADMPFLLRDGNIVGLGDIINSRTLTAKVILIFYTPRHGTTSVVLISADFSGHKKADVDVSVRHLEAVEGQRLQMYFAIAICNLVLIGFTLLDNAWTLWDLAARFRKGEPPTISSAAKALVDLLTSIMVVVFIRMRLPEIVGTGSTTERVLGQLGNIQWESTAVPLLEKKEDFIAAITSLLDTMDKEDSINNFCVAILFIYLVRVVQCTSAHPRLALLTGTISKAADDLAHAALLILLLLGLHAGIATWAFGSSRHDFRDFDATMRTGFEMMFGNFPDSWGESPTMQTFTTLYLVLVFLLVQNFLLAIIVEAYMKVREEIESSNVESAFWTDIFTTSVGIAKSFAYRWPCPSAVNDALSGWEAKFSVSFLELYETGLFRSGASLGAFIRHYARFDCCQPVRIRNYAPVPEGDELFDRIIKAMHGALEYGGRLPTLRDELTLAQRLCERRKQRLLSTDPTSTEAYTQQSQARSEGGQLGGGGGGGEEMGGGDPGGERQPAPLEPPPYAKEPSGGALLPPPVPAALNKWPIEHAGAAGTGERPEEGLRTLPRRLSSLPAEKGGRTLSERLDELFARQESLEVQLSCRMDALHEDMARQQAAQHERLVELLTRQLDHPQRQQQRQHPEAQAARGADQGAAGAEAGQEGHERLEPQAAVLEKVEEDGSVGGVGGFLGGPKTFASMPPFGVGEGEQRLAQSQSIEVRNSSTHSPFGIELGRDTATSARVNYTQPCGLEKEA